MYLGTHAAKNPSHPALIMASSGETISYGELDARSNRLAQLLYARGLRPGDHIAIFTENHPVFFDAMWAAYRSGLYWTPINSHLTPDEAAYIAGDCGARALIATSTLADGAKALLERVQIEIPLMAHTGGALAPGWEPYERAVAAYPATRLADEREGWQMMYSSGTTGRPKGILPPLPDLKPGDPHPLASTSRNLFGFGSETIYLSPAPLYHAAPSVTCSIVQRYGGTVVCMERFDAERCLEAIERYRITHGQFVPTMFVRMLKLPEEVRRSYDVSSLQVAQHAAAPCPVEVKRQMIEWWGPIIYEYYSGSENSGGTSITPQEWLEHPGSVGRVMSGKIHILDDEGCELPPGEPGTIWFENDNPRFVYHNDPEKTAQTRNARGWSTLGDVGYLDDEGYLYLTDRKAFMIISGGANIYPQEAENVLINHPRVMDVAVIGVPDPDMGEAVKAVVQPVDWADAGAALETELIAYAREKLAHYKCPRSVDFERELPRLENGKLYKRRIKDRYWAGHRTRI